MNAINDAQIAHLVSDSTSTDVHKKTSEPDITFVERICVQCKKSYDAIAYNRKVITTGRCVPCSERHVQNMKNSDSVLDARMHAWRSMCPPKYLDNDTSKIDSESFNQVLGYKLSSRGLICLGASRRGKTTSCWRLLEKLWTFQGLKFMAMTEPEFSQLIAKNSRLKNLDTFLEDMCKVQLLFLDDIGHCATTTKHLEELYFVAEKRTAYKRPIISTTQFTSEEMTDKAHYAGGTKTVMAILNRLKDACDVVIFK